MLRALKALGREARDSQERTESRQQSPCFSLGRQSEALEDERLGHWPFPLEQVGFAKYQQNTC